MKNASTKHPNDSPKTPGGISKSLLTPCRRVGLSRNWRNKGPSPFISPLSGTTPGSAEVKEPVKRETRKRKEPEEKPELIDEDGEITKGSHSDTTPKVNKCDDEILGTPKSVAIPRKKKSKLLISAITNSCQPTSPMQKPSKDDDSEQNTAAKIDEPKEEIDSPNVSTPVRVKSNKSLRCAKSPKNKDVKNINNTTDEHEENKVDTSNETCDKNKQRSPKELTKECIVVIQKKIFKTDKKKISDTKEKSSNKQKEKTQELSDSDSDVPLSHLNKNEDLKVPAINLDDDEDFINTDNKLKVKKLEHKTTSVTGLKNKPKVKQKNEDVKKVVAKALVHAVPDDDDDFECKRTIVIRKTYDKVVKPNKAKSTGSITEQDINDIKARIETKKKLLLAKAMSTDTEELRSLVKKWQKGCQDALMELMDLMKAKFPEQNMSYSEMLETLKIPASMVSYDSDNDCFLTPDDSHVMLSGI